VEDVGLRVLRHRRRVAISRRAADPVTSAELLERRPTLGEGAPGACPSCASTRPEVFHEQGSIPVHSCRLVETREEALAFPRGTLRLAFCPDCGFITNTAYDAALQDYGVAYEETQGFSPRFRDFARALAQRWIERNDLRGKTVLEIGCGKGEFLSLLCQLGENRGIGIDPAFVEERLSTEASDRLTFIRDLYDERYAHLETDAVVCGHTLEHIAPVADFLALVRRTLGDRSGTLVLFDLPDVLRVLREPAFWDVYYEHCSYFTLGSLARLCRSGGLGVIDLETAFDDQYLLLTARVGASEHGGSLPQEETLAELTRAVTDFAFHQQVATQRWHDTLHTLADDGKRVALWGSGSKAVAFLTTLGAGHLVDAVVDINPFRQGRYLPAVGARIDAPDALVALRPDVVIAMNPVYRQEIADEIARLGLRANLMTP
jgi:SAM-dependent methyltransferase